MKFDFDIIVICLKLLLVIYIASLCWRTISTFYSV